MADALDLPVEMFGLYSPNEPMVGDTRPEGDDVRRRAFLVAAGVGMLAADQVSAKADPSSIASVQALTQRIEQALIHPEHGRVLAPAALPERLDEARADYRATRYLPMAGRLINLVASVEAQAVERPEPKTYALVGDVYNAVANLLCKLPASGLEWMAIDRALRAARMAENPLLIAESQRLLAVAYRRAGRPAQALDICTGVETRGAEVVCTAAYCAAKAGDRERAVELLRDARGLAERAPVSGEHWTEFSGPNNVSVYAVSVGTALGDLGMAFNAMKAVNVAALASTERRSRFLVDVATVRLAAGQRKRAADTLRVAERIAPQAVATRPAAVALTRALR